MNIIKTTDIVDPSIQQPFTGLSLDFLQNSTKEVISALCANIITNSGYDPEASKGYIVSVFDSAPYYYVYYLGELYYYEGLGSVSDNIINLTITDDATADPVIFTDAISRNVHNHRTLVSVTGTLGTGLFDVSDLIDISKPKSLLTLTPLLASWATYTASPAKAIIENRNWITLMGGVQKTGAVGGTLFFTLPTEYRPAVSKAFVCYLYDSGTIKSCIVQIDASGDCSIDTTNIVGSTLTVVILDGIRYYRL